MKQNPKIKSGVTRNLKGRLSEGNRLGVLAQGAEATIYLISPCSKKSSQIMDSSRVGGMRERVISRVENLSSSGGREGNKRAKSGVEALVGGTNFIIKDRISKSYRIPELDKKIRKRRTKSESKLLAKASEIINSPKPLFQPSKGFSKIKMPYIKGKKLSEHLDKFSLKNQKEICKIIGKSIAKLHNADIIHGDLTTSNMILIEPNIKTPNLNKVKSNPQKSLSLNKSSVKKSGRADFEATNRASAPIIFLIDFGLGYISSKIEDKAVDLHLLKQALEAKHFKHWQELFKEVEKGYKKFKDAKIVFERLKAVEKRGRYKH